MDALRDAVGSDLFRHGLRFGLIALAGGLALALLARVSWLGGRRGPLPVAGVLVAGAAFAGLDRAGLLPPGLALALAVLGAGGLAVDVLRLPPLMLVPLGAPGAWLLATDTGLVEVGWIRTLVGVTAAVGAALTADFDDRWRARGAVPVLWLVTVLGVYATVPDTEQALVLLGASLPLALLGWPWPAGSFGAAGSAAAVGLLAWTAAAGGYGRPSSIVGAVGCLGLLAVEPLAHGLAGRRAAGPGRLGGRLLGHPLAVVPLAAAQVLLVWFESRVAGLRAEVRPAVILAVGSGVVAVAVVALLLSARPGRRTPAGAGSGAAPSA